MTPSIAPGVYLAARPFTSANHHRDHIDLVTRGTGKFSVGPARLRASRLSVSRGTGGQPVQQRLRVPCCMASAAATALEIASADPRDTPARTAAIGTLVVARNGR